MVKLNLGCGPHNMIGWYNVDLGVYPGVYRHDLSKGLPDTCENNSVGFIYSEHFIEHITRDECVRLLKDCYRVLMPRGRIRISTPDLSSLCSKYSNGLKIGIPGTWEPQTNCQAVNEGMRLWGHQFLYDRPELSLVLKEAGFVEIERRVWRVSGLGELSNLEMRPYHDDLIMEAVKP